MACFRSHCKMHQITMQEVLKREKQDSQLTSLTKARNIIQKKISDQDFTSSQLFLFLIIQNALVSYQIAGGGELWREEFATKIVQDRDILSKMFNTKDLGKLVSENTNRRYNFFQTSKYNCRLYNIKK